MSNKKEDEFELMVVDDPDLVSHSCAPWRAQSLGAHQLSLRISKIAEEQRNGPRESVYKDKDNQKGDDEVTHEFKYLFNELKQMGFEHSRVRRAITSSQKVVGEATAEKALDFLVKGEVGWNHPFEPYGPGKRLCQHCH